RPAEAAWAATEFARLPVDAQATVSNPNARAVVSATDTTRSLNDQVGLTVSFLIHRSLRPSTSPRRGAGVRGVSPPPRCTGSTGSSVGTGSRSRYRHRVGGPPAIDSRVTERAIAS